MFANHFLGTVAKEFFGTSVPEDDVLV